VTSTSTASARRAAVEDLGTATRSLVHAVIDTEVDDATLARAAALAREAARLLEAAVRPANRLPALDAPGTGRTYSPVTGPGSPVAPPVRIVVADEAAQRVEARCTLHRVHEGPPTYGHGGMSAMLLDQVLGTAVALGGRVGLTRSLDVVYHRPVPVGTPLTITARVTERTGSRIRTSGAIAAADAPDVVLVEATATFVVPRPEQLARIFGHVETAGDPVPAGD